MNAYTAVILSMNGDGYSDQQIADHLRIDRAEVTQIIDAAKVDQAGQPQVPAEPTGQAAPAPTPEPIAEAMPEVADLLAWAAAHDDSTVRANGEQAAAVLAALRERRTVDAELEQITSEESQLEERLAALRSRKNALRPVPDKRKRQERDYEPSVVRAWGRENGYEVPDRGQIPKKVLDAWRQRASARPLAAAS
ncbi:histone-like nucleoid-structuring protein Lsr2 [Streptomyces olivaceoviridis]|uniref:Lsr2 family DNA-binding protein n=1 Tax=Streptomyces olivaceoviridis TaxID=1921 RepID=UPI0033AD7DC3